MTDDRTICSNDAQEAATRGIAIAAVPPAPQPLIARPSTAFALRLKRKRRRPSTAATHTARAGKRAG